MSEYDEQLMAWKAKHGITGKERNHAEIAMHAEQQISPDKSWCFMCDKHLPVRELKLITRRLDPYCQTHDGPDEYIPKRHRVYMCPDCFKEHHPESQ